MDYGRKKVSRVYSETQHGRRSRMEISRNFSSRKSQLIRVGGGESLFKTLTPNYRKRKRISFFFYYYYHLRSFLSEVSRKITNNENVPN